MSANLNLSIELITICLSQFELFKSHKENEINTPERKILIAKLEDINLNNFETENEKIAFWINIYNALKIHLILIQKIKPNFLSHKFQNYFFKFKIGNQKFSLFQILYGILLQNQKSPFYKSLPFKKNDSRLSLCVTKKIDDILFAASDCSETSPQIFIYNEQQLDFMLGEARRIFISENFIYDIEFRRLAFNEFFKWHEKNFSSQYLADSEFVHFHKTKQDFKWSFR